MFQLKACPTNILQLDCVSEIISKQLALQICRKIVCSAYWQIYLRKRTWSYSIVFFRNLEYIW